MPEEIKVAAWKYGTIPATAGVTQVFYWDNPLSKWDQMNWDITAIGSSLGVTETVPSLVVASATVILPFTYQRSGQPVNLTAVVVLSA